MSEETIDSPQLPDQLSETLLVLDKEKNRIQVVKGIDKDGNLKTVEPNEKNQNQFMRVDKSGDFFSNFFSKRSVSSTIALCRGMAHLVGKSYIGNDMCVILLPQAHLIFTRAWEAL